jgi:integrase
METALKRIEVEIELGTFDYGRYFPNSPKAAKYSAGAVAAAADTPIPASDLQSFRKFVGIWQPEKAVEWRISHRETIESILEGHLLPYFGDTALNLITREQVLAFRADLAQKQIGRGRGTSDRTIAAITVNRIMGVLRMALDEAVLRHGIQNPFVKIKRLKQKRVDIDPFSIEQVRAILATVREDFRNYLTVRFFTGMRSGEAHGLKWRYVDFERKQILIRETFSRGRTEYTKTDSSQREIDMSAPVFEALERQKKVTGEGSEYVFCNAVGNPLDNKNFDARVWRPLLRLLGYKTRRPYQMRHTCATLWLAAGENPQWIARQLGHTTTEMLFRVYARFIPNLTRKDGSAFDQLITAAVNGGVSITPKAASQETNNA